MNTDDTGWRGRRVLVTGGAGFLGSNLTIALVERGAEVTVVDSLLPDHGGNLFNLEPVAGRIRLNISDLRDEHGMNFLVRGQEIIFNLAGQISHVDSMTDPVTDLDINCRSQLTLLECCRRHNPGVRIVYASTRQLYGRPRYLPVDEDHPSEPCDVNGINMLAGERFHLLYHQVHGIRSVSLRLTNTFGPRQLIRHGRQGFIGHFLRLALAGETLKVFGDGKQMRDINFVDDVTRAFLQAAASERAWGKIYNLGHPQPISLADFARKLVEVAGSGAHELVPWPEENRKIDIGDYYADTTRIESELGWRPEVSLDEALRTTVAYYRAHLDRYL